MPEMQHFVITQTREVEVTANSHRDAIDIAHEAFQTGQDANGRITKRPESGCWGDTDGRVRTVEVNCKRKG